MRHFPTMGKGLVPCGVFDTLSGHPGRCPCPPVTRKWRLWLVPPDYGEKPTKARRRGDLQIAGEMSVSARRVRLGNRRGMWEQVWEQRLEVRAGRYAVLVPARPP